MSKMLIKNLRTIAPIPDKELIEIPLLFKPDEIKKGTHFLKQGEVQNDVGFVLNGTFRCYYVDLKGNEQTKHFITDNEFICALSALIVKKPAQFFIQALENSLILKIQAKKMIDMMANNPFWKDVYIHLLEKACIIKEERTADFLLKDAKERYLDFSKKNPALLNKIKRYQLASYLGIAPESLSRIKKSIAVHTAEHCDQSSK